MISAIRVAAGAMSMDKEFTKKILAAEGIAGAGAKPLALQS
jgi:D-alanine-D-alanine ligase-like ATP-grasp enzyme